MRSSIGQREKVFIDNLMKLSNQRIFHAFDAGSITKLTPDDRSTGNQQKLVLK